jgi:hypothetical protein
METKRVVRYCATLLGAATIAAGVLSACGGNQEQKPSTTTPTTTTTTPSTTAPAPPPPSPPPPSPTENAPNLTPGNTFTPGPPAPPYTTHRERQYPY